MAGFRQYVLSITSTEATGTIIRVLEWDIPGSRYPSPIAQVRLAGVSFPSHRDAIDALQVALDKLREGDVA